MSLCGLHDITKWRSYAKRLRASIWLDGGCEKQIWNGLFLLGYFRWFRCVACCAVIGVNTAYLIFEIRGIYSFCERTLSAMAHNMLASAVVLEYFQLKINILV